MDAVSISAMFARFSEHWAPKKIAELNDYDIWLASGRENGRMRLADGAVIHQPAKIGAVSSSWTLSGSRNGST